MSSYVIRRVKPDINGNSRFVIHFLAFNTQAELDKSGPDWIPIMEKFARALSRAKKFGGCRYRGKDFGGGIVFQAHSEQEVADIVIRIHETSNNENELVSKP